MTQEEQWLLEEKYHGQKTEDFLADCNRLKDGEPLAYIIGSIPFLNTTIHLDSHPLIPRTETEYWVEHILLNIKVADKPQTRVLDLCAGSGCVGIAILKNTHHCTVDFAEIDEAHHETIKKNVLENNIDPNRTNIYGGDLFSQLDTVYDFILTNPPYIDPSLNRTEVSVTTYEPHRALYGGKDGMECITEIITKAPDYLTPNGTLVIEHEPEQSRAVSEYAQKYGFVAKTHEDQYGILRYTILTRTQT